MWMRYVDNVRPFWRKSFPAVALFFFAQFSVPAGASERPNVLIILCDDLGYSDIGCFGSEIDTPNLDRLAENGLRMTRFYNNSRCCPTRGALLTGLYAHQAGLGAMTDDRKIPGYRGYLNDECVTLAEVLKGAGYNTYMSGKWHVGKKQGQWPRDRGFDQFFGVVEGGRNYFNDKFRKDPNQRRPVQLNETPLSIPPTTEEMWRRNEGLYLTDLLTDYALLFLSDEANDTAPFFLYLPYTVPHFPLQAFPEDIDMYRGRYAQGWDRLRQKRYRAQIELGVIDSSVRLSPRDEEVPPWEEADESVKEEFELEMAIYAAMIDRLDRNIGRIISQLKDSNRFNNTLILFLSDNGGCQAVYSYDHLRGTPGGPNSFPCYGPMGANVSDVPFRKYKKFIHEGGILTPFIAHYPEMIEPGGIDAQPGHIMDIMATLVDLCGARYPKMYRGRAITPMQGISLKPVFEGSRINRPDPLFWEHFRRRSVRAGDWKLVSAGWDQKWELYNVRIDPTELDDHSDSLPDRVTELEEAYRVWAKECNVQPRR